MKVLIVHNRYVQPSGEDRAVEMERALLEAHGHIVRMYQENNAEFTHRSIASRIQTASQVVWSRHTHERVSVLLRQWRPDVVHVHNIIPLITPSVFDACVDCGVPVVHTLHNYRLVCSKGTLYRAGHVCEECPAQGLGRGVRYGCYRGSRLQTLGVAWSLSRAWQNGTWAHQVTRFIALSQFAAKKVIDWGIPSERIDVKPNFVYPDPGVDGKSLDYVLYLGRIAEEKGIDVLVSAWRYLPDIPLRIVGTGPLSGRIARFLDANVMQNVEFLGSVAPNRALDLLRHARYLVVPSVWYEGFPMVVAEAYACAVPVIASRIGGLTEVIRDAETGWLAPPGDPVRLAATVRKAWSVDPAPLHAGARRTYEANYTAEENYALLMRSYSRALGRVAL